jgi:hypothetical protein
MILTRTVPVRTGSKKVASSLDAMDGWVGPTLGPRTYSTVVPVGPTDCTGRLCSLLQTKYAGSGLFVGRSFFTDFQYVRSTSCSAYYCTGLYGVLLQNTNCRLFIASENGFASDPIGSCIARMT